MSLLTSIIVVFWSLLPAYLPNNMAVLAGGGKPIDGGREWNGKRILGDGKTWKGTFAGVIGGVGAGLVLNAIQPLLSTTAVTLPKFPLTVLIALSAGAMLGDITASFIKRRIDRERGAPVPGLDQLDFLVFALLFAFLANAEWFTAIFNLEMVAIALFMTPALHLSTNRIGYELGFKNEPW